MEEANADIILWNRFLRGERQAFSDIYQKYVQSLFLYGLQFTSDRELIKDCIHDLFVRLYNGREKIGEVKNIRVYLFILLKNMLIDEFRKDSKLLQMNENAAIDFTDDADAEKILLEKEQKELLQTKVKDYMALLTDRQREVIFYRYLENLEINDICDLMRMNYQSVENLIQRSLKRIRDSLLLLIILFLIS